MDLPVPLSLFLWWCFLVAGDVELVVDVVDVVAVVVFESPFAGAAVSLDFLCLPVPLVFL